MYVYTNIQVSISMYMYICVKDIGKKDGADVAIKNVRSDW